MVADEKAAWLSIIMTFDSWSDLDIALSELYFSCIFGATLTMQHIKQLDVWYWTHGNGYLKLKLDTWSLMQENNFNCHSNTCLLQSMNDPCLNILLLSFFEHEPALQIWLLSAMQPCWALCFEMEFYLDISSTQNKNIVTNESSKKIWKLTMWNA